ncbi:MAG: hypothetical protein M1269_03335 [Chloroflexi bacterium]|nr:hypothetical protein [Chloroflexota bacterium]
MLRKDFHDRELSTREIISEGTSLFLRDIKKMAALWLTIWIPVEIIVALVTAFISVDKQIYFQIQLFFSIVFGIITTMAVPFLIEKDIQNEPTNFMEALRTSLLNWVYGLLTFFITAFVYVFQTLFLVIPVKFLWKITGRSWWKTTGLLILFLIFCFLPPYPGTVVLWVIPAFYIMVKLVFVFNAVILRGERYLGAVKYSWRLTDYRWWQTALFLLIMLAIGSIATLLQLMFNHVFYEALLTLPVFGKISNSCFNLLRDFVGIYMLSLLALLFLNRDYNPPETKEKPEPAGEEFPAPVETIKENKQEEN